MQAYGGKEYKKLYIIFSQKSTAAAGKNRFLPLNPGAQKPRRLKKQAPEAAKRREGRAFPPKFRF